VRIRTKLKAGWADFFKRCLHGQACEEGPRNEKLATTTDSHGVRKRTISQEFNILTKGGDSHQGEDGNCRNRGIAGARP